MPPATPARPPLARQSSVDMMVAELGVRGLREGDLEKIKAALDDLGFDTAESLADPDAALVITTEKLEAALKQNGVDELRAGGLAIKVRKALATRFSWGSGAASPSFVSPEEVARLQAKVETLQGKLNSVDEAASASDLAEMRKKLEKISKPDVSVVGEGGQAQAMMPAHERGRASAMSKADMQQMQQVLAEHEERLNVMAANMTQQEAGGGGGGGAGSSARTKKDADDLNALLG